MMKLGGVNDSNILIAQTLSGLTEASEDLVGDIQTSSAWKAGGEHTMSRLRSEGWHLLRPRELCTCPCWLSLQRECWQDETWLL
jgi:hypothetical protein